jgi:4-amino-4-deoxy-L-arabinose transferase-like glycosyltransferase
MDEKMENPNDGDIAPGPKADGKRSYLVLTVLLFAGAVYLGCVASPPWILDDVDGVQAQIARNMLASGDWVTARLDGIAYLEKPPLVYWTIAASYKVFGVHDWSARLPVVLSAIALCLLTAAFGMWALGRRAGFYAGLCMSTCVGLFLFTRVLIPDVMQALTVALGIFAFLRALDEEEAHPRWWALLLAASLGAGMLLKSLFSVLVPVATCLIYLLLTRQLFSARIWKRLHPFSGALVALLIAVPWHVLAILRNPPYFDFTLHAGPGQYHGFFWGFFINEQLLRFLNLRYPRDYNTVPRLWFWLLHFVWLFPWSVYLPAVAKLSFKPVDRAGRARVIALVWIGFVLIFFTFSTTQEYYSMPAYPAFALLLGSAMAMGGAWVRRGTRVLAVVAGCAAVAIIAILIHVRGIPTPGDISSALSHHPGTYSLSLGHMQDLTADSFAYLRLPLVLAGIAFLAGALASLRATGNRAFIAAALMMVLFFHAARLALAVFDPYLSSRTLASALTQAPEGQLIAEGHYYDYASVFFYTNRTALLLSDRRVNLEYGSYAPGAPEVFIDDFRFKNLWSEPGRYYFLTSESARPRYEGLVGAPQITVVAESGGKILLTNHPLTSADPLAHPASSASD